MGASKNRGNPKWMSYNGNPYEQLDDLGEKPTISGNTQMNETFDLTAKDHLKTASWKTVDYHRFPPLSWEPGIGTHPMPPFFQEIRLHKKALWRETNGW